jgi:hypothetical protein
MRMQLKSTFLARDELGIWLLLHLKEATRTWSCVQEPAQMRTRFRPLWCRGLGLLRTSIPLYIYEVHL